MPSKSLMRIWLEPVAEAPLLPAIVGLNATQMEYSVEGPFPVNAPRGKVEKLKLILVSPPWPHVGDEVRYLGRTWMVTKTSATKGILLPPVGPKKRSDKPE